MGEVCLCRAGFEMMCKPNPMRKKDEEKKDKHKENRNAHVPDEWGNTE